MTSQSIAISLLAISLTGCGLGTFIKEKREAKEQSYITNAREACKRYGFVENTDTFAQCVQNDVIASKARDAADDRVQAATQRSKLNNTSTTCTNTSTGMDCTTHQ